MILLVYKVTQHRNTLHMSCVHHNQNRRLGNLIYLVHVMRTKIFKLQKETIATAPPATKGTGAISIPQTRRDAGESQTTIGYF